MPDLSAPVGALMDLVGPSVRVATGVLMRTALGAAVVVGVTSVGAAYIASTGGSLTAILAGAIVAAAGLALTGVVAVQRAVGRALVHAIRGVGLAGRVLSFLFERILGVDALGDHGERGTRAAQIAERIPLRQAQERLERAAQRLMGDVGGRGLVAGLKRRILSRLILEVSAVTLERFREADQSHGGVDLALVQDALEGKVDDAIASHIESGVEWTAAVSTLVYVGASVLLAFAVQRLTG